MATAALSATPDTLADILMAVTTAIADSMRLWRLLMAGDVEPNPGPAPPVASMYIEKQYRQFCQVHALNAYMGYTFIDRNHLLQYCKALRRAQNAAGNTDSYWNSCYDKRTGNFALWILNHYIKAHCDTPMMVTSYNVSASTLLGRASPVPQTMETVMAALPPGSDRFMLNINDNPKVVYRRGADG